MHIYIYVLFVISLGVVEDMPFSTLERKSIQHNLHPLLVLHQNSLDGALALTILFAYFAPLRLCVS